MIALQKNTYQKHCGKNFGILFLEMVHLVHFISIRSNHHLWPLDQWGACLPWLPLKYALEQNRNILSCSALSEVSFFSVNIWMFTQSLI